jgi:Xaa-Pro aminopeptidase
MLDELAWLNNLRGSDISYNPVFMGFGIVGKDENYLFVNQSKIPSDLVHVLEKDGICMKDYNSFYDFLSEIKNKRILLDPATANNLIYGSLSERNEIIEATSPVSLLKAIKNNTELNGFREAMKKDGVALVEFLFWLKSNVGKTKITEFEIGKKLAEFRSKQSNFKGESFHPIVGYKSHGAIVHLNVGPDDAFSVEPEGILLFDSGGQYLDGTTDITRTVALGPVTEQQKTDFTLVLKGMISLTLAEFPTGTKGYHLDILARKPLWENGMNYGHGTGHGVGHFLNVHEGPMAIRQEFNEHPIEPGMVMSNEPAFYREGQYGIRTENMMVCVEKQSTDFGQFLGFETLTVCPIDITLIKTALLNSSEKNWINEYHRGINVLLKPLLNPELHEFLDGLTAEIK